MIKLILCDMDNTLIPLGESHASQRTLSAIHACLDAGIAFGPATGRNQPEVASFLCNDAACYASGLFANGQQVLYKNELVHEVTLNANDLKVLEGIVRQYANCALIIFREDGQADWTGDDPHALGKLFLEGAKLGRTRHEELPVYPVVKAGVLTNVDRKEELALKQEFTDACPHLDFLNTTPGWCDVVPHGWNKAKGLRVLQRKMALDASEICVFGDAENDLALFELAGHSCAVANATKEVLAKARWHVGASKDDGVAIALEQIAEAAQTGGTPAFMNT